MFQSAPAIAGGRCHAPTCAAAGCTGFNPRPPLLAGDAPTLGNICRACGGFNPRPPLLAGDAAGARKGAAGSQGFNPRPPLLAGDAPELRVIPSDGQVSIRARHCWRAMRHTVTGGMPTDCFNPRPPLLAGDACSAMRPRPWQRCFNPRPPLLAGDAVMIVDTRGAPLVSIRARHCWRAMPGDAPRNLHGGVFQSAPAIAGGRCEPGRAHCAGRAGFNPRPPLLAGDACLRRTGCAASSRFNPRPPLLAGDALQGKFLFRVVLVSIRARHCWRAMRHSTFFPAPGDSVSIRARHCWRAMRIRPGPLSRSPTFQSAPAIAGGRCSSLGFVPSFPRCFNPRPPLLAGDAKRDSAWTEFVDCFNPRPPLLAGDARRFGAVARASRVSIRARHCWRAMPQLLAPRIPTTAFQSAPAIAGGRCSVGRSAVTV